MVFIKQQLNTDNVCKREPLVSISSSPTVSACFPFLDAISQSLSNFVVLPSPLAASATFAPPLELCKRAQHTGGWAHVVTGDNCGSRFPPLRITPAEKLHLLPGRPIVCRSHYVHNGIETDAIPRNRRYRYIAYSQYIVNINR